MFYKVAYLGRTIADAALLPLRLQVLPAISLLLYLLMLRDRSHGVGDSEHFTDNQVPKVYCELCHQLMYYRMKHCQKCGKCIHRYDHHCLLLEVCIGEFNHRWYVLFLPLQALTEVAAIWQALTMLPNQVTLLPGGVEHLKLPYYLLVLNMFLGLAVGVLCLVLLAKHLKMITRGTTTWEEVRRDTISYLRIYNTREVAYPFDEGWRENIRTLFLADRTQPR